MSDDLDPQLLAKWLAGRMGPEDERMLAAWLAADPARQAELDAIRQVWRRAGDVAAEAAAVEAAGSDAGEEARWAAILRAAGADEPGGMGAGGELRRAAVRPAEFTIPKRRWSAAARAAAAAAVAALVAGGSIWVSYRTSGQVAEVAQPMREYATSRGERAEFRLGDGTRVMLNVASRIRVPADFGKRTRTVYLEGGAYFDVVHDAARPFTVHAGDMVARDVGTAFAVRAYPDERHARVIVRTGRVGLRAVASAGTADEATLNPGESGRLNAAGRAVVQRADTIADFAWTHGTLVLDGTPLRDALPQLGRWFDLDFRLSDPALGRIPVAATLTNQPTDDAVEFLATSLGLRATRVGRVVTFSEAVARH